MLFQGLRLKETANLRLDTFFYDAGLLKLQIQTRNRILRVHPVFYRSLKLWLQHRRLSLQNATGPVFVPISKSDSGSPNPLRRQTIIQLVAHYGNQANLTPINGPDKLSPDDLRRTCARVAYKHGARLKALQAFLGFKQMDSVARYIGISNGANPDPVIDQIYYEEHP
jgi:integrase